MDALSATERDRAARYQSVNERARFVSSRLVLRDILARHLRCSPRRLTIAEGNRKPEICLDHSNACFSASRSGDVALFCVAPSPVGIDVEAIEADRYDDIAAGIIFSRTELQELRAISDEDRLAAFFRCWTRKEAVAKCTGEGLSDELQQLEVGLGPDSVLVNDITVSSFEAASGYTASVAYSREAANLSFWDWIPF